MISTTRLLAAAWVALLPGLALACPNVNMNGQSLSYTSDEAYSPRAHFVTAGGSVDLANCTQPGNGYVAVAPDFTMSFTNNGAGRALEFRVEGSCDTVLLVNDAGGYWYFDDDSLGMDPVIRIGNASEGIYDVWVGTFGPQTCPSTLIVETF